MTRFNLRRRLSRRARQTFAAVWDNQLAGEYLVANRKVRLAPFDCALHGMVEVWTQRYGAVCMSWPWLGDKEWAGKAQLYCSPNHTPWASTFYVGGGREWDSDFHRRVKARRILWGHNYDSNKLDPQLLDLAVKAVEYRGVSDLKRFANMFAERMDWINE